MNAISVILFIVGLIHIIPLKGILGITSLTALYGIEISNNDVELLLRHRAVLFGIIGFGLIYSAFKTHCQLAGITIGLISTLSFNLLSLYIGNHNALITKVVLIDWIAIALLTIALFLFLYFRYINPIH